MQRFQLNDWPRFKEEINCQKRSIANTFMDSKKFHEVMTSYGYEVLVNAHDPWGVFHLNESDAVNFILRWS